MPGKPIIVVGHTALQKIVRRRRARGLVAPISEQVGIKKGVRFGHRGC